MDATQTRANLADRAVQPSRNVAIPAGSLAGQTVFVSLTFQRAFNAEDIFDALEAKYGAGKVVADRQASPGQINLRILP